MENKKAKRSWEFIDKHILRLFKGFIVSVAIGLFLDYIVKTDASVSFTWYNMIISIIILIVVSYVCGFFVELIERAIWGKKYYVGKEGIERLEVNDETLNCVVSSPKIIDSVCDVEEKRK